MSLRPLDISSAPLDGMNLIEASAGTGKTQAITSLYLRLILERKLLVKNILVVTYTRAATHELRRRIRQTLRQALQCFEVSSQKNDKVLQGSLEHYTDSAQADRYLSQALTDFDEAAIFTIHGFSQKVLDDTVLETGLPFESELLTDETELLSEVVNDFWRKEIYSARPLWVSWLQHSGISTPDDLLVPLKKLMGKPYLKVEVLPEVTSMTFVEEELTETFQRAIGIWKSSRGVVIEILETDPGLKRTTYPIRRLSNWVSQMDIFLNNVDTVSYFNWKNFKHFQRFQTSFLRSDRAIKQGSQIPEHKFFDACEELAQCFRTLEAVYRNYYAIWWRNLFEFVNNEMSQRKTERHQVSYDDLLANLQIALRAPQGENLAEKVRHNYKAVLVDEFQDTDPVQYEIFHCIYGNDSYPFFMVGDPKQAIYSFRGADIFAYLRAREHVSCKYTLTENYRSVPGLVRAVNTLFRDVGVSASFFFDDIHFSPVTPSADVPDLRENNEHRTPLVIWSMFREGTNKTISKSQAVTVCAKAVGAEVVRLLSRPVSLGDRSVQPSDIAILVRTHQEGMLVESALQSAAVPTVRHVQESVYESEEALELERLLLALVKPSRPTLIRGALLTNLFEYDVQNILSMSELGRPWDELVTSFHHYSDLWAKNGFMRMFRELASNEGIFQRLLSYENGERRLTNLLHLAEIIEARFGKNRDITAALRWLATMRDNPPIEDKESLVRLESDEDRVKIVTLHASKGLQFPIVFLPFSWGGGLRNFRHEQIIFHDTDRSNQATLDFGSENFQKNRSRACEEELAESLRLLYVGLTRAESRCYIAWGAVNNAETSALAWLLHRPEKISDKGKIEDLIQHFSTLTYDDFMGRLNTLTGLGSPHITVQALPVFEKPLTSDPKTCSKKLVARKVRRRIDQAWSMTSFSSLTKGQGQDTERQEYGSRKNKLLTSNGAISNDIFSFPKGVRAGTCIHKIFEQIDFSSTEAQSRRSIVRRLLDVYGFEERWLDIVDSMLTKVLCTSLDSSSSLFLSNVKKSQRVDEMAFYYPILGLRSEEFYELLSDQKTSFGKVGAKLTHTIDFNALPGFMNGYIDLVFESEGRFWIVDYKSNHLGDSLHDYQAETLELVMAHEQYVLQYLIYTLAVHRFLRKKLDDYEYDRHFGGVYYLFVRGMDPNFKGDGVFFDRPSLQLIEDLDRLVAGGNQK